MKHHIFSGCATALITPFTPDKNDVDYAFFEKLILRQIECGVNALVISGTTGESPVLTKSERINCLRVAVQGSNGVIPIIAGTGSNNTQEAVIKSNEAEKEGVNGLLIVTPFYNKCTQESVVKHYFYIADRVSTPIIVYNVPSRTGFNIKPETYLRLSEHKNIVAVKEANPDVSQMADSINRCKDKLDFYSGNDDLTLPLMSIGAKGVISVASNIIPEQITSLTDSCLQYDMNKAQSIYFNYLEFMNELFVQTNPIPVKAATEILYHRPCPLRLPLDSMCETRKKELLDTMKKCKIEIR